MSLKNFDPQAFMEQQYKAYQQPRFWHAKATELREAADTLLTALMPKVSEYNQARDAAREEMERTQAEAVEINCTEPQLLPVYHMYGASLECLFKAKIALSLPQSAFGDSLPKALDGHDLTNLASKGAISLTDKEAGLLHWLSAVVMWKSRYATPKKLEYYTVFFAHDHLIVEMLDESVVTINAIFGRVEQDVIPRLQIQKFRFPILVRV